MTRRRVISSRCGHFLSICSAIEYQLMEDSARSRLLGATSSSRMSTCIKAMVSGIEMNNNWKMVLVRDHSKGSSSGMGSAGMGSMAIFASTSSKLQHSLSTRMNSWMRK